MPQNNIMDLQPKHIWLVVVVIVLVVVVVEVVVVINS
jgi:hypothetical protein